MANLLGHKAWNRTKKCKRVNCCNRPRWSQHAQRLREDKQWQHEWFEETAPDYPEWIDRYVAYQNTRLEAS